MKRLAFNTTYSYPFCSQSYENHTKILVFTSTNELFRNKSIPFPLLFYQSNRNTKSYLIRAKLLSLDQNETPSHQLNFHSILSPFNNMEDNYYRSNIAIVQHFSHTHIHNPLYLKKIL